MIVDLATHPRKFVTVPELAEYCSVSVRTLYRHVARKLLIAQRLPSGILRIPIEEARKYASTPVEKPDPDAYDESLVLNNNPPRNSTHH